MLRFVVGMKGDAFRFQAVAGGSKGVVRAEIRHTEAPKPKPEVKL